MMRIVALLISIQAVRRVRARHWVKNAAGIDVQFREKVGTANLGAFDVAAVPGQGVTRNTH
jgi:hypothetical protein